MLNGSFVNQDVLENAVGQLRGIGYENTSPTPAQFNGTLLTFSINNTNAVAKRKTNCKEDNSRSLLTLEDLVKDNKEEEAFILPEEDALEKDVDWVEDKTLSCAFQTTTIGIMSLQASRSTESCDQCYSSVNNKTFSVALLTLTRDLMVFMKTRFKKLNLKHIVTEFINASLDFSWNDCPNHKETLGEQLVAAFRDKFLHAWCTTQNARIAAIIRAKATKGKQNVQKASKILEGLGKKPKKKFSSIDVHALSQSPMTVDDSDVSRSFIFT